MWLSHTVSMVYLRFFAPLQKPNSQKNPDPKYPPLAAGRARANERASIDDIDIMLSSSCNLSILLLFFFFFVVVGFLNVAAGFTSGSGIETKTSTTYARRQQLFADVIDKGDANGGSSGGAGSWRTKTKEFLSSKSGDDVDKKLNIAFVTGNAMKQREINTILANHGATSADGESFVNLRILDVDLPEIQEINTEAVAKNKAIQGAQLAGGACVVEDTSLEFHALGGMPGPFIKWFQDKLGSAGLHKILIGYEDKAATAVCTLAFCPYPHA